MNEYMYIALKRLEELVHRISLDWFGYKFYESDWDEIHRIDDYWGGL